MILNDLIAIQTSSGIKYTKMFNIIEPTLKEYLELEKDPEMKECIESIRNRLGGQNENVR